MQVKPFIKWAGGKTQLLKEIKKQYPLELGTKINKYAEPFVGGGAVLFDVLSNYSIEEAYISDINWELINTYVVIREDVEKLIEKLKELEKKYISFNDKKRKEYYLQTREQFNSITRNKDKNIEIASEFIFLNKTCFNGLYRVNSKGKFNVPSGKYKNPVICDEINLRNISFLLQKVKIKCADYKESSQFIDENTLVYFDPPYRPLSITSSFTSYTSEGFNDNDQKELAEYINKLNQRGTKIIASNSDPKNSNKNDDFFENLYNQLNIIRVEATRMINSKGSLRGRINELLIVS